MKRNTIMIMNENEKRHLIQMPFSKIVGRFVTFAEYKLSITRMTFSLYILSVEL